MDKSIHRFRFGGLMMALDVPTGSLHVIDEYAWNALDYLGGSELPSEEPVIEALADLQELVQEGTLSSVDLGSEGYRVPDRPSNVKALCLHIAHDCNMQCRYCFAGAGAFGGDRRLMSSRIGQQAIEFLLQACGNRRILEVDFFGGEPLLNWDVVKEIVEYGKQRAKDLGKEIRFTLTTNAALLDDEITDYLNSEIFNVVLSLDGDRSTNDTSRRFWDGSGTYDQIVHRIVRFVQRRGNRSYYVRGTFTRQSMHLANTVAHIADLGIRHISLEPVVGPAEMEYTLQMDDIPYLRAEYLRLADLYLERLGTSGEFSFFHFNLALEGGPCLDKRMRGCGAGFEYLAVTPDGELFPCHQFVGQEEFRIGTVAGGVEHPEIGQSLRNVHVFTKPKCRDCWARYLCSGGCQANAALLMGDLYTPYEVGCEITRVRLEAALYVQAEKAVSQGRNADLAGE